MIPDDTGKPFSTISVDIATYDGGYNTGYKHSRSVNLKKANPGQPTEPVVIRMFVNNARAIKNIKIAVVESNNITVSSSGTQNPDGSMTGGNAGISHSVTPSIPITSYFKGYNTTGTPTDPNNVSVENGTKNSSEYIALNVTTPNFICEGYLSYRWFFDLVE